MEIYEFYAIGDRERIAISGTLEVRDKFLFMNPDRVPGPPLDARLNAAEKWPGFQVFAESGHDKRIKSYFQDAIGPGFTIHGCEVAVSEHAREVLAPILGHQARFLSLDVVGAPCTYWALYVTQYYFGELDQELSVITEPYTSAVDRRKMLRAPAFKKDSLLDDLYVFRLPGTVDYVPSDNSYATQRFFDLVKNTNWEALISSEFTTRVLN